MDIRQKSHLPFSPGASTSPRYAFINYIVYCSPGAGEQYGRPSSGGGGGGGGSGGGGGGEEGGASSNYRRIFTEEQYRMLAQVFV